MFGRAVLCAALVLMVPAASRAQETSQGEGDPYVLAVMEDFNRTLRSEWMDLRIEQIELLTMRQERAGGRIHRQPFRWVPGDPRRAADGTSLTYRVDVSEGFGTSEISTGATEDAVDRAMATWGSDLCFQKLALLKRQSEVPVDADIFDSQFGYGDFGDYRAADIVHAAWLPPDFFEKVTGPGGGETVLALSVTFIYVGLDGEPSDVDADGYIDAAHSEIYYNQGFSWSNNAVTDGGIDVESVALHEVGHALGLGHIDRSGAVMSPIYTGPKTRLRPSDHAALCSVWSSWGEVTRFR